MTTTKCIVYEKEFVVDPIHGMYQFYEEIFDPSHKIIIRLVGKDEYEKCIYVVLKSEKAQTEEKVINGFCNYVGKVKNIREKEVYDDFLQSCYDYYLAKEKMQSMDKFATD